MTKLEFQIFDMYLLVNLGPNRSLCPNFMKFGTLTINHQSYIFFSA